MTTELYVIVLLGALAYTLRRETPRLTVCGITLVGMLALYGGGFLYFSLTSGIDDHVMGRTAVALTLMWIGVLLGMEGTRGFLPQASVAHRRLLGEWARRPLENDDVPVGAVLVVACCLTAYLLIESASLNLHDQISEFFAASSEIERRDVRFLYGGAGSYLYSLIVGPVAPWVSFYLLAKWLATRRRVCLVAWTVMAAAITLAKFASLHKAPWVLFLLQTLLVLYLGRNIVIRPFMILAFGLAGAAGLSLAAAIAFPGTSLALIWTYILHRTLYVPNEGLYQTLYVYPEYLPHTAGYNVGLFNQLFGNGEFVPAYLRVADFFGAAQSSFNAVFIADAWVDFGAAGMLIMSLMVGFVLKLIDLYYGCFGKSPLTIAGIVASVYGIDQLLATSAFTAFLSGGLIVIPCLLLLARSWLRYPGSPPESTAYGTRLGTFGDGARNT